MTTVTTPDSQRRKIQVYFLASPEDQATCEDIIKHLKPITRSSPIPIEVNSDFNIPSGADREQYKQRLFEADIVLALISVDFIDNDDVYNRNQKVIERYNNHETVMIPILVRNCMWKATPFVSLPVVPKNLQPLNNKQFWNSADDAVTAVVDDIYASIDELAQTLKEAVQPVSAAPVESIPDLKTTSETSGMQAKRTDSTHKLTPSEELQPTPKAEVKNMPDLDLPSVPSISQTKSPEVKNEPAQVVQPAPVAKVESVTDLKAPAETVIRQPEPPQVVQPVPVAKVESAPVIATVSGTSSRKTTSQARASSPIAADWREKYYLTVALKRALAILLDYVFVLLVSVIVIVLVGGDPDGTVSLILYPVLYYVIMPIMESSKWQGTIGKRILKLQITNREGERITFFRALWRNIMRSLVLYSYILSLGIILVIQFLRFQKTKKFFHDELSGTVIGERLASPSGEIRVAGNAA